MMAKTRRSDEKLIDLEKRIKELEAENAELKEQIAKLKPKSVHYSTVKVKKVEKDAVPEVHEEDQE